MTLRSFPGVVQWPFLRKEGRKCIFLSYTNLMHLFLACSVDSDGGGGSHSAAVVTAAADTAPLAAEPDPVAQPVQDLYGRREADAQAQAHQTAHLAN